MGPLGALSFRETLYGQHVASATQFQNIFHGPLGALSFRDGPFQALLASAAVLELAVGADIKPARCECIPFKCNYEGRGRY